MIKKNDNIKCDKKLQSQCLLRVNSYGCKLRFFNGRCLMAVKNKKEKELKK